MLKFHPVIGNRSQYCLRASGLRCCKGPGSGTESAAVCVRKPTRNGRGESLNGRFGDDFLGASWFRVLHRWSMIDARDGAARYQFAMSLISEAHREDPKPRAPVETSRRGSLRGCRCRRSFHEARNCGSCPHTVEVMLVDSANRSVGRSPWTARDAFVPLPEADSGLRAVQGARPTKYC